VYLYFIWNIDYNFYRQTYIKKRAPAATGSSLYSYLQEVQWPGDEIIHHLTKSGVGYFFLPEEIPMAITATIKLAKPIIRLIPS
jgi:hypothetical protein